MRKLTFALSAGALALSGAAAAQSAPQHSPATPQMKMRGPMPDMTRADAQARAEAKFAQMDANKDGTFDEADRAARKSMMFDRLDADHNGSISRAELDAKRAEHAGKRSGRMAKREAARPNGAGKAERHAEHFARADTDKNGALSRTEFDAMHAQRGAARGGGMSHEMSGMTHANPGDHQAMMGKMGKMAGPITRQAFVEQALAKFDRADANRDGTVTQAERKAAHETMRQQWQAKKATGGQS